MLLGSLRMCDTSDNINSTIHWTLWIQHHSLGILVIIINGIQWIAARSCSSLTSQVINHEVLRIHISLPSSWWGHMCSGKWLPEFSDAVCSPRTLAPSYRTTRCRNPDSYNKKFYIKYQRVLRSSKTYLALLSGTLNLTWITLNVLKPTGYVMHHQV
jgi:hypothetical protein